MEVPIPLVDISSSQDPEEETKLELLQPLLPSKRKDPPVIHLIDDEVSKSKKKKQSSKSPVSSRECDELERRLCQLEGIVQDPNIIRKSGKQWITQEKFNTLLKRVTNLEKRIEKIEEVMDGLKTVFGGFKGRENNTVHATQNGEGQTSRRSSPNRQESFPNSASAHIRKEHQRTLVETIPRRNVSLASCTPSNAIQPCASSTPSSFSSLANTLNNEKESTPAQEERHSELCPPSTSNWHPDRQLTLSLSRSSTGTLVTNFEQLPGNGTNDDISSSNGHVDTVTSLNNSEFENYMATDDEGEMPHRIHIKQELFTEAQSAVPRSQCKPNDEGRIVALIAGKARKFRNLVKYVAIYSWYLSDTCTFQRHYYSELQTRYIKVQAEILAGFFVIDYLKKNHGIDGLKVTIVASHPKLIEVMNKSKLQLYPFLEACDCRDFNCEQQNHRRWSTGDSFAQQYPDDLPRLILASKGLDVKWVSYSESRTPQKDLFLNIVRQKLYSIK